MHLQTAENEKLFKELKNLIDIFTLSY